MQSLVLIPGLLSDKEVWEHQIHHLKHHANMTVVNLAGASTPDEMVAKVLSVAPDHFALAGHSMGGWVALEIMRHHAHRVTKLALLNTTARLDSPEKISNRKKLLKMAGEGNDDAIIDLLLQAFVFRNKFSPMVRLMLKRNMRYFVDHEKAMLQREDCVPLLANILCPTLIIHANQDAVFNMSDSKLLHTKITDSTLSCIDNCGHMSPIEAAEEVTDLMRRWLDNDAK